MDDRIFGGLADFVHKSCECFHILIVFPMGVLSHHLSVVFTPLLRPSMALAANIFRIYISQLFQVPYDAENNVDIVVCKKCNVLSKK